MAKNTFQTLKYEILTPVGHGSLSTEGSVADLLFDIPYFFLAAIVPPMEVVNEVLQKGVVDAGMSGGCKWKPFKLDAASYEKLVADLLGLDFVTMQPPEWVTTHSDWHKWCAELVWGIPALENTRQCAEITKLEVQREAANKDGDEQLVASLLSKIVDLSIKNSRFVNQHRASEPKLPLFRRPSKKREPGRHKW